MKNAKTKTAATKTANVKGKTEMKNAKTKTAATKKPFVKKENEKPRDLYQEVTDKIVAAIEKGVMPWVRPWSTDKNAVDMSMPYNAATGRKYNGINTMLLWSAGFQSNGWMTFAQAKEKGATVRKGEKATMIVFWKPMVRKLREDEPGFVAGEDREKKTFMLRYHNVFNVEQLDNWNASNAAEPESVEMPDGEMLAIAIAAGAKISHGGNTACYSPSLDAIKMPKQKQFVTLPHYNATLAHELTHWTAHPSRCDRNLSGRFGDDAYAFEELVAEMGASFFAAHFGFENSEIDDSAAAYIGTWLARLKQDKYAIFKAASLAKAAVKFVTDAAGIDVDAAPKADDENDGDEIETETEKAIA